MFRTSEQALFSNIARGHLTNPTEPLLLEGATGLGKTRAYLAPLLDAAVAGKRIAIVLPAHALIDQLLASSDLAVLNTTGVRVGAFRPASFFADRPSYLAHAAACHSAEVMLATAASVIIDQRLKGTYNGITTSRDFILFDEADELPASAALQQDLTIDKFTLAVAGVKAGAVLKDALDAVVASRAVLAEDRARAKLCLKCLANPAWFWRTGYDDDGGIALFHRMPGRLLKKVANRPTSIFVSATLSINGAMDDFKRALGIAATSQLSSTIEPANHGTVRFVVNDQHDVDTPEWMDLVVQRINEATGPVLVAASSYDLAEAIGRRLNDAVVRQRGETVAQAAARMGEARVLVAAGAWAGLDTPVVWKSVVVPRIPFKRPTTLDGVVESRYFDARNTALRRLRQVLGRGLRTPCASMTFYLLDPRFQTQKMEAFIPARFQAAWAARTGGVSYPEGKATRVELTAFERNPKVRVEALKFHGSKCAACDFVPLKAGDQLEVHHITAVANGQRRTNVATDTVILCCNCHDLAHRTEPARTVDELRELERKRRERGKAA